MPVLRSTVLIDAAPRTVAGLVRDARVAAEAAARVGHRVSAARRLLAAGDEVRMIVGLLPGMRVSLRVVVGVVADTGMTSELVSGPLRQLRHTVTLTPAGADTLLLDELSWTALRGPLGRIADAVLIRRRVRRWLAARAAVLVERAAALAVAPVVVATALIRDGQVLVAQRTRPPSLAGRWELPGGRVEVGESEPDAVARECREELAVDVRATGRLGTDLPIDAGLLRVHTAELVTAELVAGGIGTGGIVTAGSEPRALEHAALRWVGRDDLDAVDWVDADRAVVADLHRLLAGLLPLTVGLEPEPPRQQR